MRKRNIERMRYIGDSLSSSLCLASIAFNVVFFITLYAGATVVPDLWIGADVVINILYMLVTFYASEEAKVYNLRWSFGIAALGFVQLVRIFWLPERYHAAGQLIGKPYQVTRLSLLASAVLMLAAALISFSKSAALRRYLRGHSHG